jgi:hypothetical protein
MVAQPEVVVLIRDIAGVGANSFEYCTGGRLAKLGDVDRALIPRPAPATPLDIVGMRRGLRHWILQPHSERHLSGGPTNATLWIE